MSNTKYLIEKISKNEEAYFYEEYQDAVIKVIPLENGKTKCFAKLRNGRGEYEIGENTNLVTEATMGGEFITKEEYEKF